jgi:sulfur-oxidizing protein SoxZ
MTEPSKLRIERKPNSNELVVRMLLTHVMESGQRKDPKGVTVPSWYIQQVLLRKAGKVLFQAQLGPSVARNPFFEFVVSGVIAGESLELIWRDNRGEVRRDTFVV